MEEFIKRVDFSDMERKAAIRESIEKINSKISSLQVEIQKIEVVNPCLVILSITSILMVFTLHDSKSLWWTFLPFLASLSFNPRDDPYLSMYSWSALRSLSSLIILADLVVLFNFLQFSTKAIDLFMWTLFLLVHAGAFILSLKASDSVEIQRKLGRRTHFIITLASFIPSLIAIRFRVSYYPLIIGIAYSILYFLLLEHQSRITTKEELLNAVESLINARERGVMDNFEPRFLGFTEVRVLGIFTILVPR